MYSQTIFAGYKLGYRDFRCWHETDMRQQPNDVRFWG
jgi:hypothetical protein